MRTPYERVRQMLYLDNSATTKPDPAVLESYIKVTEQYYGNPSSLHGMGETAAQLVEMARKSAALYLNGSGKVIFTSGGTESNNLAIKGFAQSLRSRGNHLITTNIEHPSVLEVFRHLEKEGFAVTYLPVDERGVISIDQLRSALKKETILVSIMHVNNEIGSVQPIEEAGRVIKNHSRAMFHVDAVQSFGKLPIDPDKAGIDALSLSAHKFHGLKGTGLLYLNTDQQVVSQMLGGSQEFGLRSGTVHTAGAVALAKAMRLASEQLEEHRKHLIEGRDLLRNFFETREEAEVVSANDQAPHILAVSVPLLKGEVVVHALEKMGVYLSTSSACSSRITKKSHVLKALGLSDDVIKGAFRISLSPDVSLNDLEEFKKIWEEVIPPLLEGVKRNER